MQAYYNLKKKAFFEARQGDFSALDDLLNFEYIKEEKISSFQNKKKIKPNPPEEYQEKKDQDPVPEKKPTPTQPKETPTPTPQSEESDLEKQILSNIAFSFVK